MIQPWECTNSTPREAYSVFSVREDRRRSPVTRREHTFYVIETPDWINIIPVTADGKIVFIRQYRHGTDEITLEVPGGLVDPGESPEAAARREMQEETGYDANQIIYLGNVAPNPAIQNNRCYSYLALDARLSGSPHLDGLEDIEVVLVDPADVPNLIVAGAITHALVIAAFYFYEQHMKTRA